MLAELTNGLPEPPSAVAWYKGFPTPTTVARPAITDWPLDGNDTVGDCVFAGAAHLVQVWTNAVGSPVVPTQDEVLGAYGTVTGFKADDPSTDNGAVESDVWAYWQQNGLFGHQIDGFIGVNPASQSQIKDAVWFFGGALLGLDLPVSAQNQTVWDVPAGGAVGDGAPGGWGGHCCLLVGAGSRGVTMVTWGATKVATWQFLALYCPEAYALLSPTWIDGGIDPGGVPLTSLRRDLARIAKS
jgi:hypothetical protein